MKKISVIVFAILMCALLCLAGCSNTLSYSQLNKALGLPYSKLQLNVSVKKSGVTLNGSYAIAYNGDNATVQYTYDRLNTLSVDGTNADAPLGHVTGTVQVNNGAVTGDVQPDLDLSFVNYEGFRFDKGFFAEVEATKTTFKAKVTDPKGFLNNSDFACSDMSVEATVNGKALSKLTFTFTLPDSASVSVNYAFTLAQ